MELTVKILTTHMITTEDVTWDRLRRDVSDDYMHAIT